MRKFLTVTCLLLASFSKITAKDADSLALKKRCFIEAKQGIENMLNGNTPLSYERAVFLMENAYLENKVDYSIFKKIIDYQINDIRRIIIAERKKMPTYNPDIFQRAMQTPEARKIATNNLLANHAIYAYMKDTLIRVIPTLEDKLRIEYRNPFTYSFNDPFGTKKLA